MGVPSFGGWVKERRRALGFTQDSLAALVGCATVTVRKIEQDSLRPSRQMAELLAVHLDVPPPDRPAFVGAARAPLGAPAALRLPVAAPRPAAVRTNLPGQLTGFIGRAPEIARVRHMLWATGVRLVTLSGPGGIGKTRLAFEVAEGLLEDFPDGVCLVRLATVTDPALVLPAIATTLGLTADPRRSLLGALGDYLRDRALLLLLDNFEQVLEAGPAVADLLAAAPRVKALVTSRITLRLRGEREFPVPPLTVPDPARLPPLDELARSEAVALFCDRAQQVNPDFALTAENAPAVAALCAELDGLPLAIELAAARARILSPQALLPRLQHRLQLLTGGAGDLPARQQTLRAAVDWSHDLLSPDEQACFRRLAVFSGGWSLEAAEGVLAEAGPAAEPAVLDMLDSLVRQSLVRARAEPGGEAHFWMLVTIRDYATERLAASGEEDALRRRHAAFFLALAESRAPRFIGPAEAAWFARLESDQANLRAALAWAGQSAAKDVGLPLAAALGPFWRLRGHFTEGRDWLARMLAAAPARSPARAAALAAAGLLAFEQGDNSEARIAWHESLSIAGETGATRWAADALDGLGTLAGVAGDPEAELLFERGLDLYRQAGDKVGLAAVRYHLGNLRWHQGAMGAARRLYEESLVLAREAGDQRRVALALLSLGTAANDEQDYEAARAWYEEAQSMLQALADRRGMALALNCLASVALYEGDLDATEQMSVELLRAASDLGDPSLRASAQMLRGEVARARGAFGRAEVLYSDTLAIRRASGQKLGIAWTLQKLATAARARGAHRIADERDAESLALFGELGFSPGVVHCLADLAVGAAEQGALRRAAVLCGCVDGLLARTNRRLEPLDREPYERGRAMAQAGLSPAAWTTEWDKGQALSTEDAVAFALAPPPAAADVASRSRLRSAPNLPRVTGRADSEPRRRDSPVY